MFYIFIWSKKGFNIEDHVPLIFAGEYYRRMGFDTGLLTVVGMTSYDSYSDGYIDELKSLGYNYLDASNKMDEILKKHPELFSYSLTQQCWYLRWLILEDIYISNKLEQVIHLDGDILLLDNFNGILNDVKGKTFVVQGCPAFTSISNVNWFRAYREELILMLEDRHKYISNAIFQKEALSLNDKLNCTMTLYSESTFEDQDLIQYLIASKKIIQDGSDIVFDSTYYWIQNPLYPFQWCREQIKNTNCIFLVKDNNLVIHNKTVAFIHFQNDFALYFFLWSKYREYHIGFLYRFISPFIATNKLLKRVLIKLSKNVFNYSRLQSYKIGVKLNKKNNQPYLLEFLNMLIGFKSDS